MKNIDWGFWCGILIAIACFAVCIFDTITIPMWGKITIACLFLAACITNELIKKNR